MQTYVVIPTYNEIENLENIVAAVLAASPGINVIIVDDGSPDGTGEAADHLAAADERVKVIHRSGKLGLGTAYICGFKRALAEGADYICEMDADFSHNPSYVPSLLSAVDDGADVAIGSRYVPGGGTPDWSLSRRIISQGGSLYARIVLGMSVKDLTGGFKCFRRQVLEAIDLDSVHSNGYSFQIEMNYKSASKGFRLVEVPIVFPDRRVGKSKMSKRIVTEAMVVVPRLRLERLREQYAALRRDNKNP
ncbi:MAG: polyprenol monophosphomannose synthase [Chloroflexi bacterium]|nr:polyprenol monophosphomannose synthase [Chloroflexota bacterium]